MGPEIPADFTEGNESAKKGLNGMLAVDRDHRKRIEKIEKEAKTHVIVIQDTEVKIMDIRGVIIADAPGA